MYLIQAEGLRKVYRIRQRDGNWLKSMFSSRRMTVEALRSVSFSIREGELIGYIGPNGAGKSTTIKLLSGILTPDGGTCSVLGLTPWSQRRQLAGKIGVVFGQRSQLWWDLPVDDSFRLLRDIYRVKEPDFRRVRDELCDRLSLGALLQTPVRQLSLGQRMRCELAAALLHSPALVFLDEPTIGLDAASKLAVREFIRDRNRHAGMTVILTTHDMDDIEALCSRVMLIGHGRILLDGPVRALAGENAERCITAVLERPLDETSLPPGVRVQRQSPQEWTLRLDPRRTPVAQIVSLLHEQCGLVDMMVQNPPIDEIVAARYAQLEREAEVGG